MPDERGLMAPEWDQPHSSGPAPSPYASFLMAQLDDEVKPFRSATRSEGPPTATTDHQPSTTKFAKGLEASMWAPRAQQQHVTPQQNQQSCSNPTFAVSRPQFAPDHSFYDEEMDTDRPMDEVSSSLDITDEEMPDAPPYPTLADEGTTTSAPFPTNVFPEQQFRGLYASQWCLDESENCAPQQSTGKRRIRSDNSAELPTKIPRFESHTSSTHFEAARAAQVATRNEGMRKKHVRQLQTKTIAQKEAPTGVWNSETHDDDGVLQPRNGRRVGDRAPAIGRNNIGHKLLEKMGWSEGESLGKDGTGVVKPIEQVVRSGRAGLGLATFKEGSDRRAPRAMARARANTTASGSKTARTRWTDLDTPATESEMMTLDY